MCDAPEQRKPPGPRRLSLSCKCINSPQHRMYDEFVAFEKMVATKDFDSVAKRLEHSRQVMEVLDQASKAL